MTRIAPDPLQRAALRLMLQFIAVMAVVLLLVAGVVFSIVSIDVNETNQRSLAVASQLDSVQGTPSGTYVTMVEHGRQISSAGIPDGLVDTDALDRVVSGAIGGGDDGAGVDGFGAVEQSERMVGGQTYHVNTSRHGDRVVQVAVNLSEGGEELNRLAVALTIAGLVALLAAAGASFVMARRAIRPLADALALQRQFVADASHELRTPLTILSTRAQLLQRRPRTDLPVDVTEALDDMVRDSKTLTGILDDLLIAADDRSDMILDAVDVGAVADSAVATLRDDASRLGVSLTRTGGAGTDGGGVVVDGSEPGLLRLVLALVSNAVDHASREVLVSVGEEEGQAVLRVTDDGEGFDPEMARRAFDRFASTRSGPVAEGGTTHYGLGLSLVAEIARRHRGTAVIESASGDGAVVAVRIPLRVLRPSGTT